MIVLGIERFLRKTDDYCYDCFINANELRLYSIYEIRLCFF